MDDLVGAGRQDCGVNLAGRDGIDANATYAAPAKGCTRLPAMEVTFTTAPLACSSSAISPRASMMGAKKLTWNTCCQSSNGVSMVPSRASASPFGEIPALLTSALRRPPCAFRRSRISGMARSVSAALARSTWM
jgi:hypothetical protein